MKKLGLIMLFSTFLMGTSMAQETAATEKTPVVTKRQRVQKKRIREGVASGELTRRESKQLARQQRSIRRTKRQAKADGEVTREERINIAKKQGRANRNIARKKNNERDRN